MSYALRDSPIAGLRYEDGHRPAQANIKLGQKSRDKIILPE